MWSADNYPGSHGKMLHGRLFLRFLPFLYFIFVSCMDHPKIPAPGEGFVKLSREYANLYLMRAEDDWCVLQSDFKDRLKPGAETARRRSSAYLSQLQNLHNQFISDQEDLRVIVSKVLATTAIHVERISSNQIFTQGLAVKMVCFGSLVKTLTEIYHSEYEQETVLEIMAEVTGTRDWLLDIHAQLDHFQKDYQELLFNMMTQMAAKIYSSLKIDEMTALTQKIESQLKRLELLRPEMLVLLDLQEAGQLILDFGQNIERTGPIVKVLGKLSKRFPLVCIQKLPIIFKNFEEYFTRHQKLCRQYLSLNPVETESFSFDLDELDIFNAEKFNWRRFRDEFYHNFYLKNKADANAKVITAMFGDGYHKDDIISLIGAAGRNPLDVVEELVSPMLVNFPSCPHDIPKASMAEMLHTTLYFMPSVNPSAYPEYCDGVTFDHGEPSERSWSASEIYRFDSDQSKSAVSDESSDVILNEPKMSFVLNPRGLEKMREHIYNLFVAAIRNKNLTIVLVGTSCESCQIDSGQLARLLKDAATVFSGRRLVQVYVCDPDLLNHIQLSK